MHRLIPLIFLVVAGLSPNSLSGTQPFRINEVLPAPVVGASIIEVINISAAPADVSGFNLCWQFSYLGLPSAVLPAGGLLRVHLGASGTNTATDVFVPLGLPPLGTLAEGVSLYRPGSGFTFFSNPANIVDFVQYGAGNQPRADVAQAAGIWPSTSAFVPAPGTGVTVAWDGDGEGAGDWFRDASPTLGAANLSPGAAALTVGPGCSAGAASVLGVNSAVALGNIDLALVLESAPASKPGLLFVGFGTVSLPVLGICTFYVNTSPVGLELPIATDGSGGFTLPLLLDDPLFIGVELGLQAIVANDVFSPKFDMSNGLSLTF